MERLRPRDAAWLALLGSVALWDWNCPEDEELSAACHDMIRNRDAKRFLLYGAVATTAVHLCNGFERTGYPQLDPFKFLGGKKYGRI